MSRLNDEATLTEERGDGCVMGAAFSHSLIEIMDQGRIVL